MIVLALLAAVKRLRREDGGDGIFGRRFAKEVI